jgi:hypothetical protein
VALKLCRIIQIADPGLVRVRKTAEDFLAWRKAGERVDAALSAHCAENALVCAAACAHPRAERRTFDP